jgi:hypothetical protein
MIAMTGTRRVENVQLVLRGPNTDPGEPIIADPCAKPVLTGSPRAGVVN